MSSDRPDARSTPGASAVAGRSGEYDAMAAITARAGYMMGTNVDGAWTPEHAAAWEGFLELSRRLRRDAEGLLETYDDLGVSGLGIMGRLARAERRTLGQTGLGEAMGLSVSRVSRLVDALEGRGLVVRRPCPGDNRAINVELTDMGLGVTRRAQDTVFDFVQSRFFDGMSETEIQTLASVFTRLLGHEPADGAGC